MSKLQTYRDYLTKQGYCPQAHDDYVAFNYQGGTYLLPAEDQDPTYFRLILPNFWPIASEQERTRANAAACDVTASLKGVKVFPLGNAISATVEIFLPHQDAWTEVFARALHVLQLGAHSFCATMAAAAGPTDVLGMLRTMLEGKGKKG
jgi:hypothetical protein